MTDSKYPTFGGHVTRAEAYTKLMHHIEEAQDMAAVLSHLHNTESSEMDLLMAKGWLGVSEMMKMIRWKITELAKNKFQ